MKVAALHRRGRAASITFLLLDGLVARMAPCFQRGPHGDVHPTTANIARSAIGQDHDRPAKSYNLGKVGVSSQGRAIGPSFTIISCMSLQMAT